MPDDPTAPALEMSQVPRQRQRQDQRLTMRVVVAEIRDELSTIKSETDTKLAAIMSELEGVRALALAQGERRTEDLRKMIHDEVATQLEPVLEGVNTLTQVIPLVPTLQQLAADYTQRAGIQAGHERQLTALLRALDTLASALERGGGSVKPLVYAVIGVVIAANARTILQLPSWTFWVAVVVLVGGAMCWNSVRGRLTETIAARGKAKP